MMQVYRPEGVVDADFESVTYTNYWQSFSDYLERALISDASRVTERAQTFRRALLEETASSSHEGTTPLAKAIQWVQDLSNGDQRQRLRARWEATSENTIEELQAGLDQARQVFPLLDCVVSGMLSDAPRLQGGGRGDELLQDEFRRFAMWEAQQGKAPLVNNTDRFRNVGDIDLRNSFSDIYKKWTPRINLSTVTPEEVARVVVTLRYWPQLMDEAYPDPGNGMQKRHLGKLKEDFGQLREALANYSEGFLQRFQCTHARLQHVVAGLDLQDDRITTTEKMPQASPTDSEGEQFVRVKMDNTQFLAAGPSGSAAGQEPAKETAADVQELLQRCDSLEGKQKDIFVKAMAEFCFQKDVISLDDLNAGRIFSSLV